MADPTRPAGVPPATCPICGRASEPVHRPFCSMRCADADLGHWLTGRYRVPGPPVDPEQADRQTDAGGRLDPEDGLG